MPKEIKHVETLVFYDGPQLFVGLDQVDTKYLCILVERIQEGDKYFCLPISKEKLMGLKLGEIDLRDLFSKPPTDEVYFILSDNIFDEKLTLNPIRFATVPDSWFPEKEFFFEEEPKYDELIKIQTQKSNSPILHIDLNPPESRDESKISPENLSRALVIFQTLVKYAFKNAISNLSKEMKKRLDVPENYKFDVISTSGGSFNVHLKQKKRADLFGYSDIERAFRIIDNLSEDLSDPEALLSKMRRYKGHCASSYLKLLEMVIKNDMPVSYSWTMPGIDEVKTKTIYRHYAKSAYDTLVATEDLGTETMELLGRILKADHKTGKWTLFSEEEEKEYRGELSEKSKVTLEGVVIKSKIYKFSCEETIEEIAGTGREKKRLILIEYEVLS